MKWNPILLGIIDDPFSNNFWIMSLILIVGLLLCYYRYKLAVIVLPTIAVISAIFLIGFLEPQNYNHIQFLSHSMPRIITSIIILFILPFIGTYLGWRKSKTKQNNLP
jgi:uncharacterized membrane protein